MLESVKFRVCQISSLSNFESVKFPLAKYVGSPECTNGIFLISIRFNSRAVIRFADGSLQLLCSCRVAFPQFSFRHNIVKIDGNRFVVDVEVVSHELRDFIVIELTFKHCLCQHGVGSYIYRACRILTTAMLLLIGL